MTGHELSPLDQVIFGLLNPDPTLKTLTGAANEIVSVSVGTATSGTFTLTIDGTTTGTINWDDLAATVESVINTSFPSAATVTGAAPTWTVEFTGGGLENQPVVVTGDDTLLVGDKLVILETQLGKCRVYSESAPQFTLGPFVVWNFQSNTDITAIGAIRIATRPLVNVKAVTQENTWKTANLISSRIDELLMGSKTVLGLLRLDCCGREQMYRFRELDQGLRWNYLGGLYRFFVSFTG